MRHSHGQSVAHFQQEIQSIAMAYWKRWKRKLHNEVLLMVDDVTVFVSWKTREITFSHCPIETGTKWLCQTGNFWMHGWEWCHHRSHSVHHLLRKSPKSILITDMALTADKTQGHSSGKKVARYRTKIMVPKTKAFESRYSLTSVSHPCCCYHVLMATRLSFAYGRFSALYVECLACWCLCWCW